MLINQGMNKKLGIGILIVLIILASIPLFKHTLKEEKKELVLSSWIVDWQWKEGIVNLEEMDILSSLQIFALYFNETDNLYFTKEIKQLITVMSQSQQYTQYITIVNDRFDEKGNVVQKDSEMLSRLLRTSESRSKHIEEIIDMVYELNIQGVEIDYERIKEEDWGNFLLFNQELYERLKERDIALRIVLEPRSPIDKGLLPKGPTYVMMAYNLYGYHSGPGPKADIEFIKSITSKLDAIKDRDIIIAFAAGGFSWSEEGQVRAVTEKKALELLGKSQSEPIRDEESGALYFDYKDEEGKAYIVWFADGLTLSKWFHLVQELGYNKVALWRLGEIDGSTVSLLNQLNK